MSNFDKVYWALIIMAVLFFGLWEVTVVVYKIAFAIYVIKFIDWVLRKLDEYKK